MNKMSKYYIQQKHAVLLILLIAMLLPMATNAQDVLQHLPGNTLGFAVVRNMAKTSDKFEQLLEPFNVTFPAPLTFAKLVTGLDAGIDMSGDLVIAFLPSEEPKATTVPVVLLPITNYQEFAASIYADASGEICRVALLGEDILVAQDDSYALLMNVEHRESMEKLIALPAEPVTTLAPLAAWLPKQDVTLALLSSGIETLNNQKRQPKRRSGIGYELARSRTPFSQFLSAVSVPKMDNWLHTHVELAAIGVTVDDQSNIRLGEQLVFKKNSPFAKFAAKSIPQETAKLGLSSKPYVFTAGGPVAPGWGKQLATLLRQEEQKNASEYGLKNITSGLWDKEEQAYQLLFEDIRSCSVVMLTGEKGEPLVGNFLGIATVPDVSKYLESLPQVVEIWNEMTQQSTSDVKPDFQLTTEVIADNRRSELIVDIGSTARDPNVPIINWMLEATLGPEGKLRIQFAQVDPTTLVFGIATQEQITELLTMLQQNEATISQSREMRTTLDLLKPTTPWKAIINPQGCLRWTSRFCNEYLVLLSNQEVTIPDIPNSPPFGLTMDWIENRWECELLCPAATWETLGKYLETFNDR